MRIELLKGNIIFTQEDFELTLQIEIDEHDRRQGWFFL